MTFNKRIKQLGRPHYTYPCSGPFCVQQITQPQTKKDCNDFMNIFEDCEFVQDKSLIGIIADDGADYGVRGGAIYFTFSWEALY